MAEECHSQYRGKFPWAISLMFLSLPLSQSPASSASQGCYGTKLHIKEIKHAFHSKTDKSDGFFPYESLISSHS